MRIILDVDTGVDDALAIAVAVRHPRVELESVLAVAGNVNLELTTHNTLRVLEFLGAADVPVYAGAAQPLSGVEREASHWHGPDGLGGARLPAPKGKAREDAVGYLVDTLHREPGAFTLVCTAPLTNLALAIQRDARIVEAVREVVLMGGAVRPPGNVTPTAEFNIYADPEAAAIVFAQDWPVTMVGLDVTNRVTLTRAERDALSQDSSVDARLVYEVTRFLFDERRFASMALHDPLAVAVAIRPDLVRTIRTDVEVETRGEWTLGQTVVDQRPQAPPPARRGRACTEVDVAGARAFFFEALGRASAVP